MLLHDFSALMVYTSHLQRIKTGKNSYENLICLWKTFGRKIDLSYNRVFFEGVFSYFATTRMINLVCFDIFAIDLNFDDGENNEKASAAMQTKLRKKKVQ